MYNKLGWIEDIGNLQFITIIYNNLQMCSEPRNFS